MLFFIPHDTNVCENFLTKYLAIYNFNLIVVAVVARVTVPVLIVVDEVN